MKQQDFSTVFDMINEMNMNIKPKDYTFLHNAILQNDQPTHLFVWGFQEYLNK